MEALLPQNWDPMVRRAVLVVTLILSIGTLGFMITEEWGPWKAFYLTLVTLTTVGYGDYGLSENGQRFSVLLMMGGIAIVSYMLSQTVQYATTRTPYSEACMVRQANQMRNHYIVCGMGQTGVRVAHKLASEGQDIVVIDTNEEHVKSLRFEGFVALHGDAGADHMLTTASVEHASGLAAVTSCDASNAMICLGASALNPSLHIIARAECDSSVDKLRRAGATSVINPTEYSGEGIVECLVRPEISNLLYSGSADALRFAAYKASELRQAGTSSLRELLAANPRLVLIGTRKVGCGMQMRPNLDEAMIEDNETIIVAGTLDQLTDIGVSGNKAA